jgi:hypothetical protein
MPRGGVDEALAVTYAPQGAPKGVKMFYVGVLSVKKVAH